MIHDHGMTLIHSRCRLGITHSTYKDAKGSKSSLQANTPPLEERIKIDKAKVLHEGHSQVFEGQCDPNGTGEWKRCVVKKITKRAGFNEKEKQSREIEALNEFGRKKEYEEHIAKFYCSYENEDFWYIFSYSFSLKCRTV